MKSQEVETNQKRKATHTRYSDSFYRKDQCRKKQIHEGNSQQWQINLKEINKKIQEYREKEEKERQD